jgi:hypothetical protein
MYLSIVIASPPPPADLCDDCQINFSSVVQMDTYVLFQDGPFEVNVNKYPP